MKLLLAYAVSGLWGYIAGGILHMPLAIVILVSALIGILAAEMDIR